ncbi:SDR family NAD(P)-dependent oxidoreductase [Alsobacter sp. R-9]
MTAESPATGSRELSGRIALVTGAARNIGRAIALALAEGGADVAIHTRAAVDEANETARLVRETGARAVVVTGDLADPAAADAAVGEAVKALGGLDILVNNAALRREGRIETIDYAAWREIMGATLDGAFLATRAALPHILARAGTGGGRIVNIGGMTGHSGAPERVHVVTAKAGLVGFTKALAHDLAEHGVTANCVVPGMIDTVRGGSNPAKAAHHAERKILLGRRGRPEEVAGMVRYLCGPTAAFVTGQAIHVNGGTYLP